jgi:hypothetical protein
MVTQEQATTRAEILQTEERNKGNLMDAILFGKMTGTLGGG